MGQTTGIGWTDATWNVAVGCTKVSAECKYCYMMRDYEKRKWSVNGTVTRTKTVFDLPLTLKEPKRIFTSSLTDFFHEAIDSYRHEAWDIIRRSPQHQFQILTKRPERISKCLPPDWNHEYSDFRNEALWNNVWLGTSVGTNQHLEQRYWDLVQHGARVNFLSMEPLLEDMAENLASVLEGGGEGQPWKNLHWVILGGESGNDKGKYTYRPCKLEWLRDLVEVCQHYGIPVFVKQLGTYLAKELKLKHRHGADISEWPEYLQVQEFPKTVLTYQSA